MNEFIADPGPAPVKMLSAFNEVARSYFFERSGLDASEVEMSADGQVRITSECGVLIPCSVNDLFHYMCMRGIDMSGGEIVLAGDEE